MEPDTIGNNLHGGTMRRDVVSAYGLTICRVLAWLIVSAIVYRRYAYDYFAVLSLLRWTIGLLAYTSVGLGPAMVHALARARHGNTPASAEQVRVVRGSGTVLAIIAAGATLTLTAIYRATFPWLHHVPSNAMVEQFAGLILFFGIGDALRVLSEPAGAYLQTHERIATDNLILIAGEIAWALLSVLSLPTADHPSVVPVAAAFTATSLGICGLRFLCTIDPLDPAPPWRAAEPATMLALLSFGSFVLVSQLSDFLYAPTDMNLINHLLTLREMTAYAPAVQIDTGLLLLMTGLASVLLPKAATAHAAGDAAAVKRYYVFGTLWGGLLLVLMCLGAWAISKPLLRYWLGHPLPETRAILPLVLLNTAIGGSSAVGRSILLGMGRVRAFTVAVVIASVTNVIFSYCFVRFGHLRLNGIILGTTVAVFGRCAIWMPWYILRTLRQSGLPPTGTLTDTISTATLASTPV